MCHIGNIFMSKHQLFQAEELFIVTSQQIIFIIILFRSFLSSN